MFSSFNAYTPLTWFFWVLGLAALAVEVWAFIDAVRRPTAAFPAVGKQTKSLWLIILGVAAVIGLAGVASGGFSALNILEVAAFVAAAVYLTDVRPKVSQIGRGGSSGHGPYGPW